MRRIKILFIYPIWAAKATFVQRDFEILSRSFVVVKMCYDGWLFPLRLLKNLPSYDLCYVWFGGIHSFYALVVAELLLKKIIIVAGGYDAVFLPQLNYGIRTEKKSGWRRTYFSFRHADRVLAVSKYVRDSLENECRVKNNIELIYNGVDPVLFKFGEQKERFALTVGYVTKRTLVIKGFLHFLEIARKMPNERFVLIGGGADGAFEQLKKDAPPNLELIGPLTSDKVSKYMQLAAVYAQLSAQESFGVALAEAMLSGCIPVVTNRGALPEVAGPNAFCVDYGDIPATVDAIGNAFDAGTGKKQREWIEDNFRIEIRGKKLIDLIKSFENV